MQVSFSDFFNIELHVSLDASCIWISFILCFMMKLNNFQGGVNDVFGLLTQAHTIYACLDMKPFTCSYNYEIQEVVGVYSNFRPRDFSSWQPGWCWPLKSREDDLRVSTQVPNGKTYVRFLSNPLCKIYLFDT